MDKKLLFLIPSLGTGGAERQMLRLIELLAKKDVHPLVVTYYEITNDYRMDHLKLNRLQVLSKNKYVRAIKVVVMVLRVKPDLILSYGAVPNFYAIICKAIRRKIKVIVSERNTTYKFTLGTAFRFNLYRFVDLVVVNSRKQHETLISKAPFLEHKVHLITNNTDIKAFTFDSRNTLSSRRVMMKIFARYHIQKNILMFLNAVKAINEKGFKDQLVVEWYGQNLLVSTQSSNTHNSYYKECCKYVDINQLDNVHLHGFAHDISVKMYDADVICLPSIYEGFSNSLSEAICMGKPLLVSDVGDNATLCKHGENGFVFDPNNVNSIVDGIEKFLVMSSSDYVRFQRKGRAIAEELFSEEAFVRRYVDLFH